MNLRGGDSQSWRRMPEQKKHFQAPNGVTYVKSLINKWRPNYHFGSPRNGTLSQLVRNSVSSTSEVICHGNPHFCQYNFMFCSLLPITIFHFVQLHRALIFRWDATWFIKYWTKSIRSLKLVQLIFFNRSKSRWIWGWPCSFLEGKQPRIPCLHPLARIPNIWKTEHSMEHTLRFATVLSSWISGLNWGKRVTWLPLSYVIKE